MINLLEINIDELTYLGAAEPVLNGVRFTARPGDTILISGPTGSGKTTLLNCVNGIIPLIHEVECSGTLSCDGQVYNPGTPSALPFTCATVVQNPFHSFFVSGIDGAPDNGNGKEWFLDNALRAKSALSLSAGERQKLVLRKAFRDAPDVLILDEPLSNLDEEAVKIFRDQVRERNLRGGITLIAEHRLRLVQDLCAETVKLKTGPDEEILDALPLSRFLNNNHGSLRRGKLLELTRVGAKFNHHPVFHDVNLAVGRGECIGIMGPNGSGKTTLSKIIAGLQKPASGQINRADNCRSAIICDDPRSHIFCNTVEAEIEFSRKNFGYSADFGKAVLNALNLAAYKSVSPLNLSYGLQVRLAAASMLAINPDLLILDEPTQGQDENGKSNLKNIISALTAAGKSAVVISHSRPFIESACDRILTLSNGNLKEVK